MKRLLLVLSLMLYAVSALEAGLVVDANSLSGLQEAMLELPVRQAERARNLDELKRRRQSLPLGRERLLMAEKIARSYVAENIDSALMYFHRAIADAKAAGAEDELVRFRMETYALLPMRSVTRESIEAFQAIDYSALSDENKRWYWLSAAEMYNAAQMPYPEGIYKKNYQSMTLTAIDSLKNYYPPESPLILYLDGHRFLLQGDRDRAVACFMEALPSLADKPELRAFAMMVISDFYSEKPECRRNYVSSLLSRAVSSLGRGLVRSSLLAKLGEALIEEGETDLGRKCIALSLKTPDRSYADAYEHLDRSAYTHYLTDDATRTRRYLFAFSVLAFIMAVCAVAVILRQRHKSVALHALVDDVEMDKSKLIATSDKAVQNSVDLAFFIFEMLQEFEVYVSRKLKTGQAKDLYAELEDGNYSNLQREKLFEAFDKTFLSSYPRFVEHLNELLISGRRLSLQPNGLMTPELRIAAFIRLGISDSARLARGLGLSVNTVYTYRNRLRGRAVNRESFERDVRSIR